MKEQEQIITFPSSFKPEEYSIAESMFKRDKIKNLSIFHNREFVDKLQLINERR